MPSGGCDGKRAFNALLPLNLRKIQITIPMRLKQRIDIDIFSLNMPELSSPIGYPVALLIMVSMTAGMLLYFSKKGWLSFTKKRK